MALAINHHKAQPDTSTCVPFSVLEAKRTSMQPFTQMCACAYAWLKVLGQADKLLRIDDCPRSIQYTCGRTEVKTKLVVRVMHMQQLTGVLSVRVPKLARPGFRRLMPTMGARRALRKNFLLKALRVFPCRLNHVECSIKDFCLRCCDNPQGKFSLANREVCMHALRSCP